MERPDLYEIIEYAKEKGLRVVMATCGYLLDDDSITKLKKAGVSALSFSIDGANCRNPRPFPRYYRGLRYGDVKPLKWPAMRRCLSR